MYPVSSEGLNYETEAEVNFFTPAFDALNNFSAHQVALWGEMFHTAEHAFHWKKFSDYQIEVAQLILVATSAEKSQLIAHKHNDKLPGDWHVIKADTMEEILRAKLEQHDDVRELLLKTGSRTIVERSPNPTYWSLGRNGDGENMVGKIWMKLRFEIQS